MQPGASHPCAESPGQRPGASQLMPSYEDTERTAWEEATKVIEWFFADHEMRAARCEREVLDRLLSMEQVRTATIDTVRERIEYISVNGTNDQTRSFPTGSTVGDIGFGLGWYCAQVTNMYGEVLDPTSNVDEDDTVMVKENSGMVEVEEAQKLAARLQMEIEIVDLRTKCLCLAETETRIRVRVRERIAAGESRQRMDCFKRNILFPIRVAFLSCSAALHLRRGGDDSDLDQFSELIREFTPNSKGFQAVALDLEHAVEWMAVMRNALMKAHIFPRMVSNAQKKRRKRMKLLSCCSSDGDAS